MLMAARAPDVWAGVSAWCGISDIVAWHRQCTENERFIGYAKHIEKVLGGAPEPGTGQWKSARHRSPLTWMDAAGNVNLDLNHGVNDGRAGSVPFTHSLEAWNVVVPVKDRFTSEWIAGFFKTQLVARPLDSETSDPLYGERQPVFRKTSGNTRITIFDGGHEIIHEAALNWLAGQRRGKPAVWRVENPVELRTKEKEKESGK